MLCDKDMTNEVEIKTDSDGSRYWYQNGQLHRTDGPAVEYSDGLRYWYQNGVRHRTAGPAVEHPDGSRYWYQNGIRHRTDGPAVEYPNGSKEYWINGETVSAFEMWSLYKVKVNDQCPLSDIAA